MNQAAYAEKARVKSALAEQAGIRLIEIFPDTDWKRLLGEIQTEQGGRRSSF